MKPHIVRSVAFGFWICTTNDGVMGVGATPRKAYADWELTKNPPVLEGAQVTSEEWAYIQELERGYAQDRI